MDKAGVRRGNAVAKCGMAQEMAASGQIPNAAPTYAMQCN